jgi:dTDP-4-amino-4,6-dideoxygalactose transaminase
MSDDRRRDLCQSCVQETGCGTTVTQSNYTKLSEFTYFRGRIALYHILKALGIKERDNVATQAFTCIAVPEAILRAGARPLYIDIEADGFNMNPEDLDDKISKNTKAIIVQHTYGIPARVNEIRAIAEKYGVPIIEDCCHTLSSSINGQTVGSMGTASFYSYEWGKPLVVGVGGSAIINNEGLEKELEERYLELSFPSAVRSIRLAIQYYASIVLYRPSFFWPLRDAYRILAALKVVEGNYNPRGNKNEYLLRMSPGRKKLLGKKIDTIEENNRRINIITNQYKKRINSKLLIHPKLPEGCNVIFGRYPLITEIKKDILKRARAARVEVGDWYITPIHPLTEAEWDKVFYKKGSCMNAEKMSKRVITLPVHENVSPKYINKVIDFLNDIY